MKITRRNFFGFSAIGVAGYVGRSNMAEVVDVAAPLAGLRRPLRVLFVADLHMPWCHAREGMLRDVAAAFRPHLFLIGGDSVDRWGNEPLVRRFAEVQAELGQFAILGNREYGGQCDLDRLRGEYTRAGVRLLVNETVELPSRTYGSIRVVGLDDLKEGHPQRDLVTAGGTQGGAAPIVLAHCPALFDTLPRVPMLCLSGHTHGGQIAPLGIAIVRPPGSGRYVHGAYPAGEGRLLYVTRGLGDTGVPLRVGARPEIVQLTLSPG
jgi:predicted MPP superfamily phosphohydrolase